MPSTNLFGVSGKSVHWDASSYGAGATSVDAYLKDTVDTSKTKTYYIYLQYLHNGSWYRAGSEQSGTFKTTSSTHALLLKNVPNGTYKCRIAIRMSVTGIFSTYYSSQFNVTRTNSTVPAPY